MAIAVTEIAETIIISYFSVMYLTVKLVAKDLKDVAGRKIHNTRVERNLEFAELIFPVLQRANPISANTKRIKT